MGPPFAKFAKVSLAKVSPIKVLYIRLSWLKCLRVILSHLRDHKFHHNFHDTLNPLCSCSLESESTSYYLLHHCPFYTHISRTLIADITNLIGNILNFSDVKLTNLLLYGDNKDSIQLNVSVLKSTLIFLKSSERFDFPLL